MNHIRRLLRTLRLALLAAVLIFTTIAPGRVPAHARSSPEGGRVIPLGVGDTLELRLGEDPASDAEWQIDIIGDDILVLLDGPLYPEDSGAGEAARVGVWRFQAEAEGTTLLRMVYGLPGEPASDASDVYEATITVGPIVSAPTTTLVLRQADAPPDVTLAPGDTLQIELDSNPTTGYEWQIVAMDEDVMGLDGEPQYLPDQPITGGSGGTDIWRFTLARPGETVLRLIWQRPGESGDPASEFELAVTVQEGGAQAVVPDADVNLTEEQSGQTIRLRPGDTLAIALPANVTTGYEWTLAALDQSVVAQQGEPDYIADQPVATGSGGTNIWHFQAVAPGQTTLRMRFAASWEQDTAPAQIFELGIIVAGENGAPEISANQRVLSLYYNGVVLRLPVGGRVGLVLDANTTTGYEWMLDALDTSIVAAAGQAIYLGPGSGGAEGQGGLFVWGFAAVAPGQTTLRLVEQGPGGRDDVGRVFEVTILVE